MLCASVWMAGAAFSGAEAGPVPENPGIGALAAGYSGVPGSPDPARAEAIASHRRAAAAEDGAAHHAVALFEELVAAHPGDALLSAYLGSSLIMKGRDQAFLPARLVSIRQGRARLDGAVAAAPQDFDIRLLRVGSTMNLPDFVRDLGAIRADLDVMLDGGPSSARKASGEMAARLRVVLAWTCLKLEDEACARDNLAALAGDPALGAELAAPVAALREALDP